MHLLTQVHPHRPYMRRKSGEREKEKEERERWREKGRFLFSQEIGPYKVSENNLTTRIAEANVCHKYATYVLVSLLKFCSRTNSNGVN